MSLSERTPDLNQEIRERTAFLGLDAAALTALRSIKPIVDRELPRALEKFYARAIATPHTRAFFSDAAAVERAKAAQVAHWRRLSAGEFDAAMAETTRRIGATHARMKLAPKWYVAAYGIIADHLIAATLAEIWPKGPLRGGAFAKGADAGAAISALARIVMLDMEAGITAYIDALDAQRAVAEAEVAQKAQETETAVEAMRVALAQLAARNLDAQLPDTMPGVFQHIAQDFNAALRCLRDAMGGVRSSLDVLTSSTSEIATASQDLSSRTEHEASSLEQSSAALDEVTQQIGKTAEYAQSAQAIVTRAGDEAQQSNEVVAQAISAMGRIEKSSSDIGKIIGAIDEIAFQTNLLALNAGVEAARAGDAGKGFAVVASEVRGLAQRSAEAAKEIKALVAAATSEVNGGVQFVSATGEALARIGAKVGEMSAVVGEILTSARQQAASLAEIKTAVGELSSATQQNAAMAEESTAASQALARETATLADLIGQFQLGPGAAAPSARRPPPPRASAPAPRPAPKARAVGGGGASDWAEF